jgi:hypothetical protein
MRYLAAIAFATAAALCVHICGLIPLIYYQN